MLFRCPVLKNNIAQPKADKCPIFSVVFVVVFSPSKQMTVLALYLMCVVLWLEKGDCPEIVMS